MKRTLTIKLSNLGSHMGIHVERSNGLRTGAYLAASLSTERFEERGVEGLLEELEWQNDVLKGNRVEIVSQTPYSMEVTYEV